ncbi:MAG: hypothetical protein LRY75_05275 [Shewanella xiamenensis]|uniref:ParB/Sulfiredoxin domain-containing protein n=2 Tax=Shewanella TaxID=22 RepID=A0AAE4TQM0_9GAMM|nr:MULTISPECIES: hypothetical protein [Shewanella]MCD8549880.1 hypothetical protein [Shewanella xiamenensis]MCD8558235.1 hypothetical protein [Shewanella xiamenensis]MCT8858105.1 hypothetical protein [Shewanella xiamenensis]MDH0451005.1 hypothetical protein [Shewanella sp. GD04112]MDV5393143.1 hypothetical protein [Shewanella xiamenensis]
MPQPPNKKALKQIGRSLGSAVAGAIQHGVQPITTVGDAAATQATMSIKLKSGRVIKFVRHNLTSVQVKTQTGIHEHNPRAKSDITPQSLQKIRASIKYIQFMDALAVLIDGVHMIIDGQRRQMAALLEDAGLNVQTTEDDLSREEIIEIVRYVQSAEKYSYRDAGARFLADINAWNDPEAVAAREAKKHEAEELDLPYNEDDSKPTQRNLAARYGVSVAFVTRALKAIEIPQELINLFVLPATLNSTQIMALHAIQLGSDVESLVTPELIEDVNQVLQTIQSDSDTGIYDDGSLANELVFDVIQKHTIIEKPKKANEKFAQANKNRWATIETANRKTVLKISRLNEDEIQKLQEFVKTLVESQQ